jgi:hypothetical protein
MGISHGNPHDRAAEGINYSISRRVWIRFQDASKDAFILSVSIDATGENRFKDKQNGELLPSTTLQLGLGRVRLVIPIIDNDMPA